MTDLESMLARQIAFSRATFGPGERMEGVLDHISKEMEEIRNGNNDPNEWVDMVILSLDGLWRSILESNNTNFAWVDNVDNVDDCSYEMTNLLLSKYAKNEMRTWPDWRTADPNKAIEHDRSKD